MNLTEAIDWGADQLTAKQIEEARLEAEILLVHNLGIKKSELILNQSLAIDDKAFKRYKELIARRGKHEPTAYITGYQPFVSLNIMVSRSVLIPRPETEILVETVIKTIKFLTSSPTLQTSPLSIADVGTGSGAVAVALAKHLPAARIIAIDASAEALKVAQKNAEKHQVAARCQFIKGNLLEPLKEKVNIIVANPPYIPSAEIGKLQPEVKDWEPKQALDGGKDGLDYIRELIDQAPNHLSIRLRPSSSALRASEDKPDFGGQAQPPSFLFLEFGFGQAGAVESLAKVKFKNVEIIKDYAGIPRILKAA